MSAPARSLSLFDATSLIVGIIVGAGIYQMAPDVAKGVDGALHAQDAEGRESPFSVAVEGGGPPTPGYQRAAGTWA